MSGADYVIRVHRDVGEIDASAWNALLDAQAEPSPFMRHAFLHAAQASGSACDATGWAPHFLTLWQQGPTGERLQAACPLYLKTHSYGEYVFDWSWAEAYERMGQAYYPKLLCAVPFTPVPGTRLLARDAAARVALLQGMQTLARQAGLSSAHVLFLDEADRNAAREAGWMMRSSVQFHWTNRQPQPYADFDDFLASLQRDKRKKIQQERRRVREQGIHFEWRVGSEIRNQDWDFFYRCYHNTYAAHYATPYLTRGFFERMQAELPAAWALVTAHRSGPDSTPIAASLLGLDAARGVAYGRYWGCTEQVSCLHFDACYYQPLQWCIAQGYSRFEGGAQGAHKMARGLLPVQTWSAHWMSHAGFGQAVARFLARETQGVAHYVDELREHQPFRAE